MSHRCILLLALSLSVVSAFGGAVLTAGLQNSPAIRSQSVWDGVYTTAQAKRGQEHYDVYCTNCHGTDMQGDGADIPALNDARFAKKWDRRSLKELLDLISQRMPENMPASLSKEVYSDLLAYILANNGFPGGAKEIGREPDTLATIVFEETAPDPR
jgi:mono/diheme cytochrome c family protein